MEVIPEKRLAARLAAKIKQGAVPKEEVAVERAFETGRVGREAMAKVYETLLPRLRRVLAGPGAPTSSSDLGSKVKESR